MKSAKSSRSKKVDALKQSETANKSNTSLSSPSTKETKKKQMSISQSGNFNNDFRQKYLKKVYDSSQKIKIKNICWSDHSSWTSKPRRHWSKYRLIQSHVR